MTTSMKSNKMTHLKLHIIQKSLSEVEVAALYLLTKAKCLRKKMKKEKLSLTAKLNLIVPVSKLKVANRQALHLSHQ